MISALAITYNEEAHIERYLKSLSFADEIIIVDAFSTDKTKDIAKKFDVTFIEREFDNFSNQRNYAISLAKHDWILFFDLDETISEKLSAEIQKKIASKSKTVAYKVKRNFHFMGRHIKYSGLQNNAIIRVFKKDSCSYNSKLVSENLIVYGKVETLKHKSDHLFYKGYDHYNKRLTQFSRLEAKMLYQRNFRPNLYHLLLKPYGHFFYKYFVKIGLLDGKEGFIFSYLSAFAVFKRYIQLWTMYRNID